MKRHFSKNAKVVLATLPAIVVACAVPPEGDPPLPVLDPVAGEGGEAQTGGTGGMTGGTGTGGTGVSGTSGTSGATTGGSTGTGGATGGSSTGGASGQGGGSGSTTGGSGGMTGGGAGKGGSAGSTTGGSGGMTGGGAGKGGSATGGSGMTGGSAGKGGGGGSPPGGMELFRDNFEMGASNWTGTPSGVWAIATDGSMVYAATGASATSTWRAGAAGETTWTDVQFDARVKITSFEGMSTSYYAGICVRYTSNSSYACFALRSQGQVSFRVNGSNEASWNPPMAITTGRWYTVRVIARGASITGFLDGTEIPSGSRVTSGAPATGRIALACPGTNAVFDDVVVSTPQ